MEVAGREHLIRSVVGAFVALNGSGRPSSRQVVYDLIAALGQLKFGDGALFERVSADLHFSVTDADVIGSLWGDYTESTQLDVVAVLVAYCSVFPFLQPLVRRNAHKWTKIPSRCVGTRRTEGVRVFTVLKIVSQFSSLDDELFQFYKFGWGSALCHHWIPLWTNGLKSDWDTQLQNNSITEMFANEPKMHYFIVTCSPEQLDYKETTMAPFKPFIMKTYSSCLKFFNPDWMDIPVAEKIREQTRGAPSDLQLVMEVIDHPELSFLEESRLIFLLHGALRNISQLNAVSLHDKLGQLGTTQSMLSIFKLLEFILAKFLNQLRGKTVSSNFSIPHWFAEDILTKIPPISKPLFIFEDEHADMAGPWARTTTTKNIEILLQCLNYTLIINNSILKQYRVLNIDYLKVGDTSNSTVDYILSNSFFQLNYIASLTTLCVSKQVEEVQQDPLEGKLLFASSVKSIENLIVLHGNTALYHLLKFIKQISQENLLLQGISIHLLNHLFYHGRSRFVHEICSQNELSTNALREYISLWNDGSEKYASFYCDILPEKQKKVKKVTVNIDHLNQIIQDLEQPGENENVPRATPESKRDSQTSHSRATQKPATISQPVPQKSMKNYMNSDIPTATTSKYDAYSAASFVPSSTANAGSNLGTSPFLQQQHPSGAATANPGGYVIPNYNTGINVPMDTPTYTNNSPFNLNFNYSTALSRRTDYINSSSAPNTPLPVVRPDLRTGHTAMRNPSLGGASSASTTATSNASTVAFTSSPWNTEPTNMMMTKTPQNKIVNTGKNYILGGHNNVKNNSRAQSIHIDQFQTGPTM
ncbi:Vir1p KNAG_0D03750 [Huiozyma naganishii CBS 8797]|uniref:Uncharacterized protein n=1 Tax=Huiozyma naganishii (strain ATCC MYA-139 / BCRC 22969 / CBS 8797 / KCTC 17520 / NBRC 10181 / NCYC 3082 / Yp74L-3) TaxID=1071383 RepID=J7S755_HUIN7|nr:hypothetical protein KNAG_0D03750 [Kazachstania naganishii CBS 8797]CCK70121.1 hypothetical protein KNAG_0D03750 [Kazachstania naganishii CBS 8797]